MVDTMSHPIGAARPRHSQPCVEGDRMARAYFRGSPIDRVMNRVNMEDRDYASRCWVFTGSRNAHGYGTISMPGGRSPALAHRITWEHHREQIPEGLEIDHLCRVPACCNPDHLEAVTHTENVRRGRAVGLSHATKTHCKHGHPFDDGNTRWKFDRGYMRRVCRACDRRYKEAKRA